MKKEFVRLWVLFHCTSSLLALPSGHEVLRGDIAFKLSQDLLEIEAKGKAIISWESFDIGVDDKVLFSQAHQSYPILNRVSSSSVTTILGKLDANCPVYLINPNGFYVGSSAHIETAGFIASTADICDEAFWLDQRLVFGEPGIGGILHLGLLETNSGNVLFVARQIESKGVIHAREGRVTFATTELVLNSEEKGELFIRLQDENSLGEQIIHSGSIKAMEVEFKSLSPYACAISHEGIIHAVRRVEEGGRVYLTAAQGGCIVNGSIFASGGEVQIDASKVSLSSNAVIDVSSESQPGAIRIEAPARSIHVDSGACLRADALEQGDGGFISILGRDSLVFHGLAQAQGGIFGGSGGQIHFSSQGNHLDLSEEHPVIDLSARHLEGHAGTFFLDPKWVTIIPDGMDSATGNTFGSNPADAVMISGAVLQMALDAANVVIQANTDILFQDEVEATSFGNGLTLQAGRSILFNGSLILNGGDLIATINDGGAIALDREGGLASFNMEGSSIATQGGNIEIDVGNFAGVQIGEVFFSSASIDAGGGNISIKGFGRQDGTDNVNGVYVGGGSLLQTAGTGTVTLEGTGGNGANINVGVYLENSSTLLQVENGLLHVIGHGGGDGSGNGNAGVFSSANFNSTGLGDLFVEGIGGSGVHFNMGMIFSNAQMSTIDSNMIFNGTGSGTGAMNFGVRLESQANFSSTGAGAIQLTGLSGNGKNNNHGVILSGGQLTANTGSISITGNGLGSLNYNYGVRLEVDSICSSMGTAPITVTGHNMGGNSFNAGVSISCQGVSITSGYGNIQITGISDATGSMNEGVRIESGQVFSTGTGMGSATIWLNGTSGPGTDFCNGVSVLGEFSEVSAVDGDITVEGTKRGSEGLPIFIDPQTQVNTTGTGTVTYIEH